MAYMNQEKKANISALLKPILKKYNVKATLSVRNHSTICLNVKSGSIDFFADQVAKQKFQDRYIDVNSYHYRNHFCGVAKAFLIEAFAALKGANWYDRTDAQIDYFDTAYYTDVNIGSWNKPYEVV
jgi:hypothetical protein